MCTKKLALAAALLFMISALLSGCGAKPRTQLAQKYQSAPERKVIIDCDTGADDASALILAAKSGNLDILGVTVLAGNVDLQQGAENALSALELAGSDAPVYMGAAENYNGERIETFSVFGSDGMGDAGLVHPKGQAAEKNAVDFILETANQYPDEVELIALGPATNIAKAIEKDPESMKKIKRIWSMGSAGLGPGNASPVAEFNVYSDPEAYQIMLNSGIDITVVGLDMCGGAAMWTNEQFERLQKANDIGGFVAQSFGKIREFYASNGSADSVMNCDAVAMMCVIHPEFVNQTIQCHGNCMTDPGETFGQVIFYQEGFTYDALFDVDYDYNVTLTADVNQSDYFELYLAAIQ